MTGPVRVAVIQASTRPGGTGTVVGAWFEHLATNRDDLKVDPVRIDVPAGEFRSAIDEADAVVIVTPEYNHSFPGPLKSAIDTLRTEWVAKPVGFVTYGGISGGLRAAEALRLVFGELHAATIRETVSFAHADRAFDHDGQPLDRAPAEAAADRFLAVLGWWARALREARGVEPYPV